MEYEVMRLLAGALVMGIGTLTTALAMGRIGGNAMDALGRNPEARPAILTHMILAIAFVEAIAIYALVIAIDSFHSIKRGENDKQNGTGL